MTPDRSALEEAIRELTQWWMTMIPPKLVQGTTFSLANCKRLQLVCDAAADQAKALGARPLNDWHEDTGPVLWWKFPIEEPPYVGTPLDQGTHVTSRFEFMGETRFASSHGIGGWPGYHTHWTPIITPAAPRTRLVWKVTETSYGRVNGWRHFLTQAEADETAAKWRSQNVGVVTVEQVEVEA